MLLSLSVTESNYLLNIYYIKELLNNSISLLLNPSMNMVCY